ncbi:hypothetical protein D4R78_07045, partial [bacterium]
EQIGPSSPVFFSSEKKAVSDLSGSPVNSVSTSCRKDLNGFVPSSVAGGEQMLSSGGAWLINSSSPLGEPQARILKADFRNAVGRLAAGLAVVRRYVSDLTLAVYSLVRPGDTEEEISRRVMEEREFFLASVTAVSSRHEAAISPRLNEELNNIIETTIKRITGERLGAAPLFEEICKNRIDVLNVEEHYVADALDFLKKNILSELASPHSLKREGDTEELLKRRVDREIQRFQEGALAFKLALQHRSRRIEKEIINPETKAMITAINKAMVKLLGSIEDEGSIIAEITRLIAEEEMRANYLILHYTEPSRIEKLTAPPKFTKTLQSIAKQAEGPEDVDNVVQRTYTEINILLCQLILSLKHRNRLVGPLASPELRQLIIEDEIKKCQGIISHITGRESEFNNIDSGEFPVFRDFKSEIFESLCGLIREKNLPLEVAVGRIVMKYLHSAKVLQEKDEERELIEKFAMPFMRDTLELSEGPRDEDFKNDPVILVIDSKITAGQFYDLSKLFNVAGVLGGQSIANTHWVISCSSQGIPVLTGIKDLFSQVKPGEFLLIPVGKKEVIVNPTPSQMEEFARESESYDAEEAFYKNLMKSDLMGDNERLKLVVSANADNMFEVEIVKGMGVGHIGLVRSECLFGGKFSDVQKMASFFIKIAAAIEFVDLRSPDKAKDKEAEGLGFGFGYYRTDIGRQAFLNFITASLMAYKENKNIRIFYPMVNSKEDIFYGREIIELAKNNLVKQGYSHEDFEHLKIGAMIETRQAVKNIRSIATAVDFISIGTNDLTADILGVRREKETTGFEPKAIRSLENIFQGISDINKKRAKLNQEPINVCVCGELAHFRGFLVWLLYAAERYHLSIRPSVGAYFVPRIYAFLKFMSLADVKNSFDDLDLAMTGEKTEEISNKVLERMKSSPEWKSAFVQYLLSKDKHTPGVASSPIKFSIKPRLTGQESLILEEVVKEAIAGEFKGLFDRVVKNIADKFMITVSRERVRNALSDIRRKFGIEIDKAKAKGTRSTVSGLSELIIKAKELKFKEVKNISEEDIKKIRTKESNPLNDEIKKILILVLRGKSLKEIAGDLNLPNANAEYVYRRIRYSIYEKIPKEEREKVKGKRDNWRHSQVINAAKYTLIQGWIAVESTSEADKIIDNPLTKRERSILETAVNELIDTNREVADKLNLKPYTIQDNVTEIDNKLDAGSATIAECVKSAYEKGFINCNEDRYNAFIFNYYGRLRVAKDEEEVLVYSALGFDAGKVASKLKVSREYITTCLYKRIRESLGIELLPTQKMNQIMDEVIKTALKEKAIFESDILSAIWAEERGSRLALIEHVLAKGYFTIFDGVLRKLSKKLASEQFEAAEVNPVKTEEIVLPDNHEESRLAEELPDLENAGFRKSEDDDMDAILKSYLAFKYPTREEQKILVQAIREREKPDADAKTKARAKQAQDTLINGTMQQVIIAVRSYKKDFPCNMPALDLAHEVVGYMIRKLDKFDPDKGDFFAFIEGARDKKGGMTHLELQFNAIIGPKDYTNGVKVPVNIFHQAKIIKRTRNELKKQNGGVEPEISQIAAAHKSRFSRSAVEATINLDRFKEILPIIEVIDSQESDIAEQINLQEAKKNVESLLNNAIKKYNRYALRRNIKESAITPLQRFVFIHHLIRDEPFAEVEALVKDKFGYSFCGNRNSFSRMAWGIVRKLESRTGDHNDRKSLFFDFKRVEEEAGVPGLFGKISLKYNIEKQGKAVSSSPVYSANKTPIEPSYSDIARGLIENSRGYGSPYRNRINVEFQKLGDTILKLSPYQNELQETGPPGAKEQEQIKRKLRSLGYSNKIINWLDSYQTYPTQVAAMSALVRIFRHERKPFEGLIREFRAEFSFWNASWPTVMFWLTILVILFSILVTAGYPLQISSSPAGKQWFSTNGFIFRQWSRKPRVLAKGIFGKLKAMNNMTQEQAEEINSKLNIVRKKILAEQFFREQDFSNLEVEVLLNSYRSATFKQSRSSRQKDQIQYDLRSFKNADFLYLETKHELWHRKIKALYPEIDPALTELFILLFVNIRGAIDLKNKNYLRAKRLISDYKYLAHDRIGLFKFYEEIVNNPRISDAFSFFERL